ncbi:HNH endonuclease signature motif containing protein [Microbispora sp. KK1-11]|uniref:HNH endonuclease signature motif containing protein n=1 Tax=Microbispora sp. KK1-11 TaxID=2053005 RepID=UPI00115A9AA2|nr:HNH endonuclease signature motif containing protein [Microbispora sp. KK1-11]TQS27923.1 DUF222 domain-containing protein [Microbispora sp. KK1-11]
MDLFDSDPEHLRRSNSSDSSGDWWDRLTSGSRLWSADGSVAREHFPIIDPELPRDASQDAGDDASADSAGGCEAGAGRSKGRSSWVLVGSLRELAQALALAPLPDDAGICRAEAEELLFARDRITSALADRVGRVHGAGQAKQHGHASTRSWLRTAAGMSVAGAGRLLTLAVELARLPRVREKFAEGGLAAGVVEAICTATAQLSDEHAALAEPILLELAGKAGAAEVAKAGRYLRAVLDPDGEDRDEQADYARRFLRVRPTKGGGLEGEFYLPREAAARLRALLDAYAKPRAEGDDRPLRVRQADAFIALLEEKIAAELLVLVNAESLPTDPGTDHSADAEDPQDAEGAEGAGGVEDGQGGRGGEDTSAPGDTASADDARDIEDSDPSNADAGEAGADAGSATDSGADAAADAVAGRADLATTGPRDEESPDPGADEPGADEHDTTSATSAEGDVDASMASTESDDTEPAKGGDYDRAAARTGTTRARRAAAWPPACGGSTPPHPTPLPLHTAPLHTAPLHTAQLPDPPPEDPPGHHAHAGHRPAGDRRHAQDTPEGPNDMRGGRSSPGTAQEASPGALPGAVLGTAPGLLLATGQVLPVSSVHRLARTSTLVRLVMDAEGQVLDMGRKVRLATPAQRRAIFARYATCWIDGCPLPATMCQIDHADNWSTGGLTNLKLLGPACQFHNRDRYRHPDRYTRHKIGTDRWTFTYQPTHTSRLRI